MSNVDDVKDFMLHLGMTLPASPRLPTDQERVFRLKLIHEELTELETALNEQNLVEAADALVDLVYVLLGGALQLGLPWEALWAEIHTANMKKVPGTLPKRRVLGMIDAIKPPDWTPPDVEKILFTAGLSQKS